MKTTKPLTRLGLCITLLLCSRTLFAEPVMNGIAESIELNKERFIAALYTSSPSSNPNDLLRNQGERRMELKITADRLSAKALNSMWIEGMAINNGSADLRAESESLSQLVNMVRKSLYRGDTLTFDAQPGAGMTVTLNGLQLGNIASDDFFSMVLRTWIGSVPLSSEFKTNLLAGGNPDDKLRDRFAVLQPTQERIAAVEGWSAPTPPAGAAQPAVAAAAIAPPPRPRPEISSPRPEIVPPRPQIEVAPPRLDPEPQQSEPEQVADTPDPVQPETPAPKPAPPASQTAAAPTPKPPAQPPVKQPAQQAPAQVTQSEPKLPSQPVRRPATPPPVEEDEEEAIISAESILDRQLYISNVLRQTQKSVRYPDRALRREQEGTVRVTVTVDKNGKLLDAVAAEESRYGILNKEAIDSFGRAEPFEKFPASIREDNISFTIPITFQMPSR